jgi:hypothetical protein
MSVSSITEEEYSSVNGADADGDLWTDENLLIVFGYELTSAF